MMGTEGRGSDERREARGKVSNNWAGFTTWQGHSEVTGVCKNTLVFKVPFARKKSSMII